MTEPKKPHMLLVALLYLFSISTILYPPLARYAQPSLVASFAGIICCVLFGVLLLRRRVPKSRLFLVVWLLACVYAFWTLVAVVHGNDPKYIGQDSFGFAMYLLVPFLYTFIKMFALEQTVCRVILNLCTLISVVTLLMIVWYYSSFGMSDPSPVLVINAILKSYDLNWLIDNNNGMVGMYTSTAHFLLLGIGLVFYNYITTRKASNLWLILLYAVGIFGDGHRALVISLVIMVLLLCPLIIQCCSTRMLYTGFSLMLAPLLYGVVSSKEWFLDRFSFTSADPSTLERMTQTPALLDKIMQHPLMGSGFGSYASVIRSQERPFSYEVDFLATVMKLGLLGSFLYFGIYLLSIFYAKRYGGVLGYIMFSVGISFFFYMSTNGNTAMSTDSAIFHLFLFLIISIFGNKYSESNTREIAYVN